jgi:hypothetical protein
MSDNEAQVRPTVGRLSLVARLRPWVAVVLAAAVFALVPLIGLPLWYALPLIGLVLAFGVPADYGSVARPIAPRPRNVVIGALVLVCLAFLVTKPQLMLPLVLLVGLDAVDLAAVLVAVATLILPLAMADSPSLIDSLPQSRPVLTRRNLMLCLTVAVSVAVWYAGPGLSFLPIAILVLGLPIPLVISRLLAARRNRLESGLLRKPMGAGLGWHRLQLVNMLLLCFLLAFAILFTGAYDATTFDFSAGDFRAFQVCLFVGLAVFLLAAVVPLRHVRVASNILVMCGSAFMAAQLVMIYRPVGSPVTIASPLAEEWLVGHGGRAELVNYHRVTSTQGDALDILEAHDGRTHRPGNTELNSYYIYGKPVLAPADGVVTFVLDGRPDLPIGATDNHYQTGNQIVIDIGGGRYVMMAHLSPGSIQVKVGDRLKLGQPIARVGNSGNTSEPHVHIQAQTLPTGIGDVATLDAPVVLRTLHTYPLVFADVVMTRRGVESRQVSADPRRGDLIRPAE